MKPAMIPPERDAHFVQSLERGLAVIRAFDAQHPELTLSEVARHCDLTRAAARRFLLTLADLGYVRTDGRLFRLTPRVLELGYAYLSSLSLPEVAAPHLERLVAEVHESSSMSVLDGDDVVYVARVPTARIMTVAINVGTRFPAYATSMGRVLLAALPDEQALDAYLTGCTLERLTPRTVTSPDALRAELDAGARPGLRDRRPGAGGAACARWRRRCATAPARRSPRSTCRRTPAARRSTGSAANWSPRSAPRPPPSNATWPSPDRQLGTGSAAQEEPRCPGPRRCTSCTAPSPRRASASSSAAVRASRAPLMPSGWPSAIAPPFGLTWSASSGRPRSRSTARAWAAKASFSSTTSTVGRRRAPRGRAACGSPGPGPCP